MHEKLIGAFNEAGLSAANNSSSSNDSKKGRRDFTASKIGKTPQRNIYIRGRSRVNFSFKTSMKASPGAIESQFSLTGHVSWDLTHSPSGPGQQAKINTFKKNA